MPQLGTDIETELGFLQALEKGEVISQMSLSKRLRISVGMVNALVKRAAKKGYVKARSAPAKRFAYYLTPEGFTQKSRLVAEYIDHSLHFFRDARAQYLHIFERERANGIECFVLYGSGELAEIAILAAFEAQISVKAIVDKNAASEQIGGVAIVPSFAKIVKYDCIVIVEQQEPQAAYDHLRTSGLGSCILVPAILGVQI